MNPSIGINHDDAREERALLPLRTHALHPLRNDGVPFCMRTFIVPLLCKDIVPLGAITYGYCWSESCYVPVVMEDIECLEGTAHTLLVMSLTCKTWRDDLVNFVPAKYLWKWPGWKQTTRDYFDLRRRMQQQAEDAANELDDKRPAVERDFYDVVIGAQPILRDIAIVQEHHNQQRALKNLPPFSLMHYLKDPAIQRAINKL